VESKFQLNDSTKYKKYSTILIPDEVGTSGVNPDPKNISPVLPRRLKDL